VIESALGTSKTIHLAKPCLNILLTHWLKGMPHNFTTGTFSYMCFRYIDTVIFEEYVNERRDEFGCDWSYSVLAYGIGKKRLTKNSR